MSIDLGDILPPQLEKPIWQISPAAIKNTMTYIFDVLRHPCYLVGIRANKVYFYKVVPGGGTAPTIIPALKTSLATLNKNRHMTPQQIAEIKRGVNVHDTRIMQCILKTFAEKPEKLNEYYRFLSAITGNRLQQGVYLLNLTDATILREDGNLPFPSVYGTIPIPNGLAAGPFLPIMGAGQKGYYDIPIPNYDEINRIVDNTFIDYLAAYEMDWDKKRSRAIFRGGPSGCGATAETNMRIALSLKKHPLVDSCIVGRGERVIKYDPKLGLMKIDQRDIGRALCHNQKGTPMTVQSGYKYIIHIDGNVNAYRLLGTMLTGSLILRVRSNYIHWADHLLKPNVHFVEISADLSNLSAVIEWCQKHDRKCREIAAAGLQAAAMLIDRPFIESVFIKYMGHFAPAPAPAHDKYSPHSPAYSPLPSPFKPRGILPPTPHTPNVPPPVTLSPIIAAADDPHILSMPSLDATPTPPWPKSPDYPPPPEYPRVPGADRKLTAPMPPPNFIAAPKPKPKPRAKRIPIVDEVVAPVPQAPVTTLLPMPPNGRCPRGYNRAIVDGIPLCKSKEAMLQPPPFLSPIIQKVVADAIVEKDNVLLEPDDIPLTGKRCPAGYGAVIIQTRKYCRRKRPAMGGTRTYKHRIGGSQQQQTLYEKENLKTIRDKETAIEVAMAFV